MSITNINLVELVNVRDAVGVRKSPAIPEPMSSGVGDAMAKEV